MILDQLTGYLKDTLGIDIYPEPIPKDRLIKLPLYLSESYTFYDTSLFAHPIVLAQPAENGDIGMRHTERNLELLKNTFHKEVALLLDELPAYGRKRLIQRGIGFIVPGRQLFLPALFLDLQERSQHPAAKRKKERLLPSAQLLVIYHIIHRNKEWKLEGHSLKNIAEKLGYTPMGITKAVENLSHFDLVDVAPGKEKSIHFRLDRHELWERLERENLLIDPVLKRVFVDEKPKGIFMLESNASALPEYTDMNPERREYYALGRKQFYELQEKNVLIDVNEHDGPYCLEVWKYDPQPLVKEIPNDMPVVDPLSLYLSLKDLRDERIELALEQIKSKYIW